MHKYASVYFTSVNLHNQNMHRQKSNTLMLDFNSSMLDSDQWAYWFYCTPLASKMFYDLFDKKYGFLCRPANEPRVICERDCTKQQQG